ncbi:TetR/AcrR family transcriptional regulator C-terminal domain-containing protein [Mycolicibacterium nivoides]|uniref:TetR/AcrR family transcriptional regulator C-terminal domain-containing protein n=1 Tax=Mycolicibacterium nivoides TaxID=2487344 RepID=A0ABW9LHH4_9MYCO
MAKLTRDIVVAEALDLLDDVGLDAVSTRRLAQRLGVEQPALYWHFQNKAELLAAMAGAAMAPLSDVPLPESSDDWAMWFAENMRSFRCTLLLRRDGARLHAGSRPAEGDSSRIAHKLAFLVASGFGEDDAAMAMLAASRFTVGSVLEEQADNNSPEPIPDHTRAFEAGLALIINGMRYYQEAAVSSRAVSDRSLRQTRTNLGRRRG